MSIDYDKELEMLYGLVDTAEKDDLAKIKLKLDLLDRMLERSAQNQQKAEVLITRKPYPQQNE